MGGHRRWRLSCLTVKIPAHKMGVTLEGQAEKIRESLRGWLFLGFATLGTEGGLHALGRALFRVLEMLR